uniref:Uncharacterized protein n=1 Tax=Rhizophora mucronata TaxID=61149 RepID=A0A2P2NIZ0_RHIMU
MTVVSKTTQLFNNFNFQLSSHSSPIDLHQVILQAYPIAKYDKRRCREPRRRPGYDSQSQLMMAQL